MRIRGLGAVLRRTEAGLRQPGDVYRRVLLFVLVLLALILGANGIAWMMARHARASALARSDPVALV